MIVCVNETHTNLRLVLSAGVSSIETMSNPGNEGTMAVFCHTVVRGELSIFSRFQVSGTNEFPSCAEVLKQKMPLPSR